MKLLDFIKRIEYGDVILTDITDQDNEWYEYELLEDIHGQLGWRLTNDGAVREFLNSLDTSQMLFGNWLVMRDNEIIYEYSNLNIKECNDG